MSAWTGRLRSFAGLRPLPSPRSHRRSSRDFADSVADALVGRAACRTTAFAAVGQSLAALAHPADAPGGHAGHQYVRLHVLRHDRPGSDERVLAERDAA